MYAIAPQQHYLPTSSRHPPPLPLPPRAMNPTTPTTTNTNEGQMNPPPPPGSVFPTPSQAPPSTSAVEGGRIYSLAVVQQPVRARMCGFGDKDRRPITPPPCVRLIVKDASTNKEVDINEIDTSYYVLTVDLWSADGTQEVNLVRHSAHAASISSAVSSSYPPPPVAQAVYPAFPSQQTPYQSAYTQPRQLVPGSQAPPVPVQVNPYGTPHNPQGGFYPTPTTGQVTTSGYYQHHQHHHHPPPPPQQQMPPLQPPQARAPTGMFTRNLIGSLSASAFRLTDPDNRIGVWFILQDLSVRTEGQFRLKMNFVNVGDGNKLNTGSAPVLASTFSDVFQVFSAKKFPGVIESTNLSKCFATQGIKIPIRKDGPKAAANREEFENED